MIEIYPYLTSCKTFEELTSRYISALRGAGPENFNVAIVLEEYLHKESKTFVNFVSMLEKSIFDKIFPLIPVNFEIYGRKKSLYSYVKKLEKVTNVRDVKDIYGIRVVVNDATVGIEEATKYCYLISKTIIDFFQLQKFTPDDLGRKLNLDGKLNEGISIFIPESIPQFIAPYAVFLKDYISNPKANGYQSIHLGFQKEGRYVDVQIRTTTMHNYAEYGGASHDGLYKPPVSIEYLRPIHIDGLEYDGAGHILRDDYGIFRGLPIGQKITLAA